MIRLEKVYNRVTAHKNDEIKVFEQIEVEFNTILALKRITKSDREVLYHLLASAGFAASSLIDAGNSEAPLFERICKMVKSLSARNV